MGCWLSKLKRVFESAEINKHSEILGKVVSDTDYQIDRQKNRAIVNDPYIYDPLKTYKNGDIVRDIITCNTVTLPVANAVNARKHEFVPATYSQIKFYYTMLVVPLKNLKDAEYTQLETRLQEYFYGDSQKLFEFLEFENRNGSRDTLLEKDTKQHLDYMKRYYGRPDFPPTYLFVEGSDIMIRGQYLNPDGLPVSKLIGKLL